MAKLSRPRSGDPAPLAPFFRLVPLFILTTFLIMTGLGGCGSLFSSPGEARSAASERIAAAVKAEESGYLSLADAAANDAVAKMGNSSAAVSWVAGELTRAGRPHTALRLLKVATKTPALNDDPNVYLRFALAQEQVGNKEAVGPTLDEAERRADSLRTAASKNAETRVGELLKVGSFWAASENPRASTRRALDALRAAHGLLPDDPLVQNSLGYILADRGTTKGEWREALTLTRRAVEKLPEEGAVLDSLGWALYKTGDIVGAQRVLRKAVDLERDMPEARCHLGIVFATSKQYRNAAIELRRALQLWPRYEEAERVLKTLPPDALQLPAPTPAPTPLNAPISAPIAGSVLTASPLASPSP